MIRLVILALLLLTGAESFLLAPPEPPRRNQCSAFHERARRQVEDDWPRDERTYDADDDIPPWFRGQARNFNDDGVLWHPEYEREDCYDERQFRDEPRPSFKETLAEFTAPDYYEEEEDESYHELTNYNKYSKDDEYSYEDYDILPSDSPEKRATDKVLAAGVGTAAVGMLVGGPIGAAVLGFSTAYAAENDNDVVGDGARAIGEVAMAAGKKSVEINQKHHVVDKTIHAAEDAWEMAKELDREHHIVQKAKDVAIYGGKSTVEFVKKHNLVERSIQGLGQGIGWVSQRVVAGSLDGVDRTDMKDASLPPPKQKRRRQLRQGRQQEMVMPPTPYDDNSINRSQEEDYQMPVDDRAGRPRPRRRQRRPRRPRRQPEY